MTHDDLTRAALDAIGMRGMPAGRALDRIAKRMARVLGVGDLVRDQRLPLTNARLAVKTYAATVAMTLQAEEATWSEEIDFDGVLQARFGVRKFVIAAGKSSRFSPTELIHKQIARPDGSSTNLAQSRLAAAGIGGLPDVVVVDPLVAYRLMAEAPLAVGEQAALLGRLDQGMDRFAEDLADPSKLAALRGKVRDLVASELRLARHPEQAGDFAHVMRRLAGLAGRSALTGAEASAFADEVGYLLASWLIECGEHISPDDVEDYCGPNCMVAVAPSHGPGAAYMAGVQRLENMGTLGAARYSLCIYSDYPAFLLDQYPNLYLNAYLCAMNRFELQRGEPVLRSRLPVITIGAKQPADTVQDRGNIILRDTRFGPVPQAIREWRDMSREERRDAQKRFAAKGHAINAGLFVIDTPWALSQFPVLCKRYNHPDPAKGKLREYWYTDLVAIAAKRNAPRRVLWLGESAPMGNKDVPTAQQYATRLHDMMRGKLLALGVWVDPQARVNVVVRDADADLDLALARMFGGTKTRRPKPDQVQLLGEVEIDSRCRIGNGVCLDGRAGAVRLCGRTTVGHGVHLRGVCAEDTVFQAHHGLDGYVYEWPRLAGSPTAAVDSRLVRCRVEAGAVIERSTLSETYVAGGVTGCELAGEVVAPGDDWHGLTAAARRERLSVALCDPDAYVPGLLRGHELGSGERARMVSLHRRALLSELRAASGEGSERAVAGASFFFESLDVIPDLTEAMIERYAGAPGANAARAAKASVREACGRVLAGEWTRLASTPPSPARYAAALARAARLAAQANAADPLAEPVRRAAEAGVLEEWLKRECRLTDDVTLALEDFEPLRRLAQDRGPGTFIYVLDGVGELEADALVSACLCMMGHRVLLVAKRKAVAACATCADVEELLSGRPLLRQHRREGALRVIDSGSSDRGLRLDLLSAHAQAALASDRLHAVILKGQANLFTTAARNRVCVPVCAMLAPRGKQARAAAGVPGNARVGKSGVLAVIPAGEAVVTVDGRQQLHGDLRAVAGA